MMTLKQWMSDQGITQHQAATLLGVSQPTLCRWINLVNAPDIENIINIRKVTGGAVTADSIVNEWEGVSNG